MAANVQTMMSVRETPWHGLGVVVDAPVSNAEAFKLSGLDWTTSLQEVYTSGMVQVEGSRAVVRSDNGVPLGIVSENYTPVQNQELFDFARDLGQFDTELHIETAGALGQGETVWALVRMGAMRLSMGNDVVDPFLLLVNGHCGNRRLSIYDTAVRVVCQNTLRMADNARGGSLSKGWDLKHTANIQDRMKEAQQALNKVAINWQATKESIQRMAEIKADESTLDDIIFNVFGESKEEGKGATIAQNRAEAILENWQSPTSTGLDTEGSLWTAINAVTEWIDHQSVVKNGKLTAQESRFMRQMLPTDATDKKTKVWDYALTLI